MPEPVVDSLDAVDESLRPAYVEIDGKFNLDYDKYAEVKAQGLKSKNKELLGKLTKATDGLKKFEKFADFEDDDLAELLELREQKKNQPPTTDPNKGKGSDELQAQFDKFHNKEKGKWNEEKAALIAERDALKGENRNFKLMFPLRDIATKAGVLPEDLDVAMMETAKLFVLDANDEIVMLDKDGDPTDVTPEKFYGDLYKVKRPKFYAPSGASGSGAPSSTASTGGKRIMRRAEYDKMQISDPQRAQAFLKEVSQGKAELVDN